MPVGTRYPRATLPAGSVDNGDKNVAVAGTPEPLVAAALPCRGVLVRAKAANTGAILVGPQAAPAFPLNAGETLELRVADAAIVWLDAAVGGEGVHWIAEVD